RDRAQREADRRGGGAGRRRRLRAADRQAPAVGDDLGHDRRARRGPRAGCRRRRSARERRGPRGVRRARAARGAGRGDVETDGVRQGSRGATPVLTFRRTTTREVELHGRVLAPGEKVVLFYHSANRDEQAFADPWRFDLARDPNRHVGFGGGGPHYCLGASLARTQLRSIFTELLTRLPDLEVEEPERYVSAFIDGVKRMECTFTPRA